jgi:hypothetical protein
MKICKYCAELDPEGFVCPDEPHHGSVYLCEECGADYYEEWGGNLLAGNEQASINRPELKKIY